jgi:hypothetical protein
MVTFADFVVFDDAAVAVYPDDHDGKRHCRECLCRLSETARQYPGMFSEAVAKRDVRKGVAFKSKTLDDLEHGVFAQRLGRRLGQQPAATKAKSKSTSTPAYGDFLRQSVRSQGDVLGDMNWEQWEVCKAAMELGGVDSSVLADPKKAPAERLALVGKINWANITLPNVKAKRGPSFHVPDDWRRAFGIERLKRIKTAVEQGQAITDPQEQKLLHIWKTLEVQFGGDEDQPSQILPSGPTTDVGLTPLPMSPTDRKRFYRTLTGGKNESIEPARATLQLSPQSAYDYLMKYGVEIISDDEAKDLFLSGKGVRNRYRQEPRHLGRITAWEDL